MVMVMVAVIRLPSHPLPDRRHRSRVRRLVAATLRHPHMDLLQEARRMGPLRTRLLSLAVPEAMASLVVLHLDPLTDLLQADLLPSADPLRNTLEAHRVRPTAATVCHLPGKVAIVNGEA